MYEVIGGKTIVMILVLIMPATSPLKVTHPFGSPVVRVEQATKKMRSKRV